jgi:hypothetical protein
MERNQHFILQIPRQGRKYFFYSKDERFIVFHFKFFKGFHSLGNSNFGNFLELTLKVFNEKNLSEFFKKEVEKNSKLQSISFELCGRLEPHLVRLDFL